MVIKVSSLSFSYPSLQGFSRASFEIREGDFVAVIGPNGAGKTTLIRLLLSFLRPQSGSITLFGTSVSRFSRWDLVGYVPQRLTVERLFPGTVAEVLSLNRQASTSAASRLGIDGLLHKRFAFLSGGEQQRVLIALALQSHPRLLILDEPAVGIDVRAQRAFYGLLKELNEKDRITILLVTHEVGMVPAFCKSVLCLSHNLCCQGHAAETGKLLKRLYGPDFIMHHHGQEQRHQGREHA